jgi:DNA-binding MarR family transcriptional regulator
MSPVSSRSSAPSVFDEDATLATVNVLLRIAARSVLAVEEIVTTPQLRVLVFIAAEGPQNLGAVAAELGVHASNATRTCERLVQSGFVARTENPNDRRFVQLALTRDGDALVKEVLRDRRTALNGILAQMDAEDRNAVAAAFRIFADTAGDGGTTDGRFTFSVPIAISK